MIRCANERVDAAIFHTNAAQVFESFCLAEINQLAFNLRTDHERFGAEMMLRVILNESDIFGR